MKAVDPMLVLKHAEQAIEGMMEVLIDFNVFHTQAKPQLLTDLHLVKGYAPDHVRPRYDAALRDLQFGKLSPDQFRTVVDLTCPILKLHVDTAFAKHK